MTPYAQELVKYVQHNGYPSEVAAINFLDSCLDPLWQMMTEQPKAAVTVIEAVKDE